MHYQEIFSNEQTCPQSKLRLPHNINEVPLEMSGEVTVWPPLGLQRTSGYRFNKGLKQDSKKYSDILGERNILHD